MPRLSAGILVDHLWDEELIAATPFPQSPQWLMARPSDALLSAAPDFVAGARLLLDHLEKSGCDRVYLGVPFAGDQAVDAAGRALQEAASSGAYPGKPIEVLDCSTLAKRKAVMSRLSRLKTRPAIVCTEDNITSLLWREMAGLESPIQLVAMQGTGMIDLPITRLRYDYRRLGGDVVNAIIERGKSSLVFAPTLISEP